LSRHLVTVLHLACGLDSRALRLAWQRPKVRWIDVDVPEVVEIRKKLRLEPPTGDYTVLGTSVIADGWLEQLPTDRPVLVVMEGLTMYLPRPNANLLLYRIASHFGARGGQLIFDGIGIAFLHLMHGVQRLRPMGITLGWTFEDPKEIEALHPKFKVVDAMPMHGDSETLDYFSWLARLLFYVMSWIPYLKSIGRLVRVNF
jgi:O-methyltransferase involved in polyketide biosynthesis